MSLPHQSSELGCELEAEGWQSASWYMAAIDNIEQIIGSPREPVKESCLGQNQATASKPMGQPLAGGSPMVRNTAVI